MAVNQLKAGAVLSYVIIALNSVIGLVYTPFMLRTMGKSEYGLYALAASVIAYLTVLDLGFGNAVVRYTAKFRAEGKVREQQEMFGMFIILYAVISVIAFALGMVLCLNAGNIFDRSMTTDELEKVRIMLALLSFNLAFTFPMSVWRSIITAYEDFVFQRVLNILRIVLNPLVMTVFLIYGYRAITMVVITTVFNVLSLTADWWYCHYRLSIRVRFGRFNWKFLREVAVYSFWIFLNAIMDRIYWSTGQFVLGIYRGTAAVAVYAVAIQLQQMYMLFSSAISGVFLPRITSMVSRHCGDREISDLFVRTGRVQYLVMAYILAAFIVFGRAFIDLWAGPGYEEAYPITLLFFIPLTVPLIQNVGINVLMARNQMKFRSLVYVGIALLSLGASVWGAKMYGGIGCAVATAAALALGQILVMNIYYARRQHLDISRFWREIGRMSIVPLVFCGLGCWASHYVDYHRPLWFVLAALVFTVLYLPCCWRFMMNASERALVSAPLSRIRSRLVA